MQYAFAAAFLLSVVAGSFATVADALVCGGEATGGGATEV
jgi:hypothetical protein